MRVLAISSHPDDETLGCGGTLLRHASEGDQLFWIIATQTHEPQWTAEAIKRKGEEVDQVAEAYGFEQVLKLGYPSTQLDTIPQGALINRLREAIQKIAPQVVYTVHTGDVHSDHRVMYAAVASAMKAFNMAGWGVERLLSFETLSSTEAAPPQGGHTFLPTVYREITPFMERKLEIMALYGSESQEDPLPRGAAAIRALARFRGATVGVQYAEAFMLIREAS